MNEPTKHGLDFLTFLGGLAAWAKVFTDLLGFVVALAGVVWWSIRFYEWYKEKKNGNVRKH